MNIVSVVGARPQFIKLKPVHESLNASGISHNIVHTGQHYDPNMSDVFFDGLDLPSPTYNLEVGSLSHGAQTGSMITSLETLFTENRPDLVLLYGDTNSTLAGAISASKMGILIGHIEAGLRSHNRSMPEEINRIVTDHVSDLLFAPTNLAQNNLIREGLKAKTILTGDVMADLIFSSIPKLVDRIPNSFDESENSYVVATIHRASNTDDKAQLERIFSSLSTLAEKVYLIAHPRLISMAQLHNIQIDKKTINVVEPQPYLDMLAYIQGAKALITDSGGLQKEAYLLGVPCITIRTETEWPETLAGNMNVLSPTASNLNELMEREVISQTIQPFGAGNAAQSITKAILELLN